VSFKVAREPRKYTKADYFASVHDLPERVEFAYGEIGPYSDEGKRILLANWGVDEVIRLTGPEIWREALAALLKNSDP
jgi:hypothetical protein